MTISDDSPEMTACGHVNLDNGYICTRQVGHNGFHAANFPSANPTQCFARWDESGRYFDQCGCLPISHSEGR